jgi:NAD(P)-dependent dehydrogenase (short-subunit alcohol dehydrogenase family)
MRKSEAQRGAVAFVTGGASGIGRALSEELVRRGAEVVLADRQLALAEEVARALREKGGRATACEVDVCNLEAFRRAVDATLARTGRIDYLFNNAGIGVGGEVLTYRREDWDDVFDVNIRGVAYGIQAVYPHMVARGRGHIVNTASVAGLLPPPEGMSYTTSKHAVVGLSRALRIEAARHGVRVSALCPGVIRTPILTGGKFGRVNLPGVTHEKILAQWEKLRPIEPEELARRALDEVERNVGIIVVPRWWKALWMLDRLMPTLSSKLWGIVLDRTRRELGVEPTEARGGQDAKVANASAAEIRA